MLRVMPLIFWCLAFLIIDLGQCSVCNYVYEEHTLRAYPIDECLKLGTNSYIKYQCESLALDASEYTIVMQRFADDQCVSGTNDGFDLLEWIAQQNQAYNTSLHVSYYCGGSNQCFTQYTDVCRDESQVFYYPYMQCLNDYNKSVSFRYECDASTNTYTYALYDGLECVSTNYNSVQSQAMDACRQYTQCKQPPSVSPTALPTIAPTPFPTFYNPFENKSLDDVIQILKNRTNNDNHSVQLHKVSWSFFLCFELSLLFFLYV